jgi:hypothetical protein
MVYRTFINTHHANRIFRGLLQVGQTPPETMGLGGKRCIQRHMRAQYGIAPSPTVQVFDTTICGLRRFGVGLRHQSGKFRASACEDVSSDVIKPAKQHVKTFFRPCFLPANPKRDFFRLFSVRQRRHGTFPAQVFSGKHGKFPGWHETAPANTKWEFF